MSDNPGKTLQIILPVVVGIVSIGIVLAGLLINGVQNLDNWVIASFTIVLAYLAWQTNVSSEKTNALAEKTHELAEKTNELAEETITLNTKVAELQKRQIDAETLPDMQIFLTRGVNRPNYIWMIIENCGGGVATNLKFTCEPDFETISGSLNENYDIFKFGMSHFPPKHRVAFVLTNFAEKSLEKRRFVPTITIRYNDEFGGDWKKDYKIELCQFWGQRYFDRPSAY